MVCKGLFLCPVVTKTNETIHLWQLALRFTPVCFLKAVCCDIGGSSADDEVQTDASKGHDIDGVCHVEVGGGKGTIRQ